MRTWHAETAFVALVLAGTALAAGGRPVDWISASAVLCSFGHASVSDRLVEREAARAVSEVECTRWAARYWIAKELLWVAAFVAMRSWPALVGCGLFLAFPAWRRFYRARQPRVRADRPMR